MPKGEEEEKNTRARIKECDTLPEHIVVEHLNKSLAQNLAEGILFSLAPTKFHCVAIALLQVSASGR